MANAKVRILATDPVFLGSFNLSLDKESLRVLPEILFPRSPECDDFDQ
jgi:hypothetical protein